MKKLLFTLLGVVFAASSASAMPFMLNPDAVLGTSYGQTSLIDQLGGLVHTTSDDPGVPGGAFTDVGNMTVNSLAYLGSALGSTASASYLDWQIVGNWSDLTGTSIDGKSGYVYNPGATLTLYAREGTASLGTNPGVEDDTGITGVKVATLKLVNATIGGDAGPGVSIDFDFDFTEINEGLGAGFWLDENGNPLSLADLGTGAYLRFSSDANTDRFVPTMEFGDGTTVNIAGLTESEIMALAAEHDGIVGTKIYASHHFTAKVAVVPEPATMALFGTGLLGLAGAGFRKKKQA